ncbi:MAG: hypothetical protein ACE5PV_08145 [Candidatus Poribacteria bacterium]
MPQNAGKAINQYSMIPKGVKASASGKPGKYEEACQTFANKVSKLNGVVIIGALPHPEHVVLWTITNRRSRSLDRAIIEQLIEVVREYKDILFDFVIIQDEEFLPKETVVLYKKEE